VILIPRFGAVGAAVASSAAYLVTTFSLVLWYRHVAGSIRPSGPAAPVIDGLSSIPPDRWRRGLDIAIGVVGLALSWPLLLVLMAAARLSTGSSAIYRQVRVGQGGVPFPMYKLRSMRAGLGGPEITGPDDRRITRLGAVLRATSLDELPQFWNVLRGDMTLVGPRPETVALALRYPTLYQQIFRFRPGITGPVQVRLRDAVPDGLEDVEDYYLTNLLPARADLDMRYLANATLGSTLILLAETATHVLSRVFRKLVVRSQHQAGLVGELKSSA
jgi:lipopolysaccharide/colanic/teichoic acid biosynthesis glycosyltransferase